MVFEVGYADFTAKHRRPHLWVRGTIPFRARMIRTIVEFLEKLTIEQLAGLGTQRAQRDLQFVVQDFDGAALGPEYACLRSWDIVECWNPVSRDASGGWEYGLNCNTGRMGWFPLACLIPCK